MTQDDPLDRSSGTPADPERPDDRDWEPVRDDFLYSGMAQRCMGASAMVAFSSGII
ncbi:hypothetical protein [Methyloceanibacter superfactus]|uniref:hypothetical protein n=1 Tax=Methyloceanibacter superfactus TaxID=1774969 RepID=UPI0013010C01|nr:hypothetical protein [Methyloceanibacter superfactus]